MNAKKKKIKKKKIPLFLEISGNVTSLNIGTLAAFFITLDPRLPFLDSVGGMFPGPATTQRVYQGIEWFSQLVGLTKFDQQFWACWLGGWQ